MLKRRVGKRSARSAQGPSASAMTYNGPSVPRLVSKQTQIEEVLLTWVVVVGSDASGTLNFLINNMPTSSGEWIALSGIWEEYRYLSFQTTYAPTNVNFIPSTIVQSQAPIVHYSVRDSGATPPASYDSAWQIGSARLTNTCKIHSQVIKMSGSAEAVFTNTRTPGGSVACGGFANGLTPSISYASVFVRTLTQFRGRR